MIYETTVETPYLAWKEALFRISASGILVDKKKLFDGIIVTEIQRPTDIIQKNPLYGQMFIDEYKKQFLNPDKKGFEYTYGQRLCQYPDYTTNGCCNMNQIKYVIKMLQEDSNSRRAQAITWNPFFDADEDYRYRPEDVPCLQLVRCVIVNGRLNMEVVFRSHDMLKGYYPNVLGLSYLMDYIVKEVGGVTKGYLRVVSMSPHVYTSDRDTFRAVTRGTL